MSLIPSSNKSKSSARRTENSRIHAHPLPIILSEPSQPSFFRRTLNLLGASFVSDIFNPLCQGVLDAATRSVWVLDKKDAIVLWQRGFFGKGDLSRSEPSWLARRVNARRLAKKGMMTSEEVTAKRRAERKQFKLDRAKAMAVAVAEAEAAFQQGRVVSTIYAADGTRMIPSAATWKPKSDAQSDVDSSRAEEDDSEGDGDDEPIEDVEHLQLTLQEAFFLLWTLDCLSILDPDKADQGDTLTLSQVWNAFQNVYLLSQTLAPSLDPPQPRRFDNPFLLNYVVYHHYRSLGWVVKSGIKFCVDYLLYKRGPVFAHAEFAVVVCPVYEDPADRDGSQFDLTNASPFSWSWLGTINRVNSQVQKTLVLSYLVLRITLYEKSYYDGSYRHGCEINVHVAWPVIRQPGQLELAFDGHSSDDGYIQLIGYYIRVLPKAFPFPTPPVPTTLAHWAYLSVVDPRTPGARCDVVDIMPPRKRCRLWWHWHVASGG